MQQMLTSECIHAVFCLNASTVVLLVFFCLFFLLLFFAHRKCGGAEIVFKGTVRNGEERLCTEKETKRQTRQ